MTTYIFQKSINQFLLIFTTFIIVGILIYIKISAGESLPDLIYIGEETGLSSDDFLIFWPDEVTYITWLETRYDSFQAILAGERDATNLFGYFVGGFYELVASWRYIFFIGLIGFIMFYLSAIKLFEVTAIERKVRDIYLSIFILSPTVIMLASGVLRELYVLAVVNMILVYSYQRRLISVLLCLLLLFFLRNFYIVILFPVFVYFWNFNSVNRFKYSMLASMLSLMSIILIVLHTDSLYETSYSDVLLRMVSGFTGLNVAVVDVGELFKENLAFKLERLSLIHQFIVMIGLYVYVILRGFRISGLLVICFFVILNLSLMYGYFLGYFVARTKLIIIWLVILYMALDSKSKTRGLNRNVKA